MASPTKKTEKRNLGKGQRQEMGRGERQGWLDTWWQVREKEREVWAGGGGALGMLFQSLQRWHGRNLETPKQSHAILLSPNPSPLSSLPGC